MALRKCKILSIFFYLKTSQKASNMLMQHSSTTQTKPKLIKIDIFFSAIFWDKLRGHFRMLKSQNISHALCAHFSWLRTARWDEKSGWWRCPKLDAKTLPNSQQPKRKKHSKCFKKNKRSQLQILVVNWPVAQMASIATKWNQTNSMAFSPVQGFVHSELLNMYSNALT